jgi:hypothetical protein
MLSKHSVSSNGEYYIPWDSAPGYGVLVMTEFEDLSTRIMKVKIS